MAEVSTSMANFLTGSVAQPAEGLATIANHCYGKASKTTKECDVTLMKTKKGVQKALSQLENTFSWMERAGKVENSRKCIELTKSVILSLSNVKKDESTPLKSSKSEKTKTLELLEF